MGTGQLLLVIVLCFYLDNGTIFLGSSFVYSYLSASIGCSFDARQAGIKPATTPVNTDILRATNTIGNDILAGKTYSLINAATPNESNTPRIPPIIQMVEDSKRN